ncbi:MBL fold metallo-hydrolase [Nocardioides pocheonensis]|jgi:glyoxylase-like metal-dependent hydrolase (beta-lactamase superfamily II)|uniref:MBL fold metallo-hydrolase n=1 Tax=Nocardioides pocheonensis TaxID=661485 RepID=A0A3N0GJI1_9ACTN|nr:MBL fold metallo-hydrolase [Nocardioides pocheonensis]RNM12603.1 MBL fold metallo-hydrolase [Nocardioides pocheonensis]
MTSAIRHLNCATMSPRLSMGGRFTPARLVAHCLLVEGDQGLTLVDTGFGTADLAEKRMGKAFIRVAGPSLDPAETAVSQVRSAGYDAGDVTDIVLTHLDLDHAGGLGDFPEARVHVFDDELAAATARSTLAEKNRYIPAQWAHGPRWIEHAVAGESWLGFEAVKVLSDDVLLVPLRGHTRGHCGVAVRRPSGGWFLHAGDSYFAHGEKETPPTCPRGLSVFQSVVQMDKAARHANAARVRALHAEHGPDSGTDEVVTVFSAHDAVEFDALADVTD